jgi:hypothetical protein
MEVVNDCAKSYKPFLIEAVQNPDNIAFCCNAIMVARTGAFA